MYGSAAAAPSGSRASLATEEFHSVPTSALHSPTEKEKSTSNSHSGLGKKDDLADDYEHLSGSKHETIRLLPDADDHAHDHAHDHDDHDDEESAAAAKPPPNIVDRALNWLLPPGSIPSSAFNLCAATLGAGTVGLPYAMAYTGAVIGSIALALCGAATVYTIDLLIQTLEVTGHDTYEKLSRHLIGPKFEKTVAFLIVAFCWGVACVYVVVVGSIIKPMQVLTWMPQGIWGDRLLTAAFWLIFMLPLSNLRDINSLRYASLVGFLATCYLVLAIVLYAALEHGPSISEKDNVDLVHAADFNFWSSLTVFSFSYCCQTNAFEIYHELKQRSVVRMRHAAMLSMSFCTCLYIISGVAGLAAFGYAIESNILTNFANPQNTGYLVVAFISITFTVTLAFPVAIFPTRDAVLQLLGYKNAYSTPNAVRYLVCTLLAASALVLGLFVPNIQILFSILGGVCGSSLGYCLPVLFAWKAGVIAWNKSKSNFVLGWTVFSVGAICGFVGTLTTLISLFNGSNKNSLSGTNHTAPANHIVPDTNASLMMLHNLLLN